MPPKNIGTNDRLIRFSIAVFLLGLAFLESSWILFFSGIFVLYEALVGWCAFYQLVGRNSCPIDKK